MGWRTPWLDHQRWPHQGHHAPWGQDTRSRRSGDLGRAHRWVRGDQLSWALGNALSRAQGGSRGVECTKQGCGQLGPERDLGWEFHGVLVHSCYYKRIPQTGWLINNRNLFLPVLEAGMSKMKVSTDFMFGEGPLSGS